jgi:hypothetical protein
MQELKKLHADPELVKLLKTIIRKSSVREYGSRMITPVRVGIPQGGILSPLLANLYGSIMDREMRSYKGKYMRYADDLIILCASMDDCDKVMRCVQRAADKMKVEINMDKTFIGRITETTVFSIGFSENGMYRRDISNDGGITRHWIMTISRSNTTTFLWKMKRSRSLSN